jgi:outer membrane receptor protein involved in Fe transport
VQRNASEVKNPMTMASAFRSSRFCLLTSALCLLSSAAVLAFSPLTGIVHAANGAPVSGARVVVHARDRDEAVTTDGHGAFSLPDVELPALVEVTAAGFEPARRTVVSTPTDFTLGPANLVESVVVSADRAPAWRDASSGATILGKADLVLLPAVTLDESLRAVSGFSLFRRSSAVFANPTTDGVTMRGLSASGSSRGLILLDGVPLNDGFGGWVTWTRLPTEAVARVDVDRGAAGDAFGSDALGGVIRIITPTVEHPGGAIGVEGGSTSLASLDLSGGLRRGRLSFFGATSALRTDGSIVTAPEARGPIDIPTDATWTNAFGRTDVNAGAGQHVTIEGWGGRDDRGNGTPVTRNRMTGGTIAGTYTAVMDQTTVTARAADSPNNFDQTFSTVASGRASETLTSTQASGTNTFRAIVELGRTLPRAFATIRGTFSRAGGTFTDTKPTSLTTKTLADDTEGVSAEAGWTPAGPVTVDVGARHEWRAAPTSDSTHDEATVGHVGAVWQISAPLSVRATAATSHRWPTLNELVRDFQAGNVLTLANPNLIAEDATSVDASLFLTRRRWLASVGVFHTTVDNAVVNVTQPAGTVAGFAGIVRQRENAGDAHATGLELDGEVHPTLATRLRVSTTVLSTSLLNSPELALVGNRLPQVPRVSAALSGDAAMPGSITGSFVWHAVSSQFDDDRNQFLIAPAYQLDLRLAGRVGPTEWHVIVENTRDSRIETGRSSATLVTVAPGRAVRVGVVWRR